MTDLVRAADVSVWSGEISEAQWDSAKRHKGIDLAIVGSWHGKRGNEYARTSLDAARKAGLDVATYVALNHMHGYESVENGLRNLGVTMDLKFIALDVEVPTVTVAIVHEAIRAVKTVNLTPIIYTGKWFWKGKFGDPRDFSDIPLWTSRYDGFADLLVNWESYGGWKEPTAKQYQGTNHTLGFGNDLSVFRRDFIHG